MQEHELQALHEEVVGLFAEVFAVTARALDKLAELDAKGCAAIMHYQSTAHYLNHSVGMSLGAAREHVRVARALVALPVLKAALATGSVSYSKLRALSRIATPATQADLLGLANASTASQLEKVVRGCRKVTREQAKKQSEARAANFGFDDDGMFYLRVRLMPDEGARLMAALDAVTPNDTRSWPERRADAVMALASSSSTTELVVHVEAESSQIETPRGEHISVSAETSRRLGCDASVVVMTHDADGNVLDVGRKTRKITAGLRRAVAFRDQGCRYPGCPNTLVDAHHIQHWADGGETKLSNLIQLCRFHHTQLHEGGYSIEVDAAGTATFMNTYGTKLQPASVLPAAGNRPPLVTSPWGGTTWSARHIDYSYVVAAIAPKLLAS